MSTRRQFPGGLRAQLLLGLCFMLLATFALVLVTVENVVARQVRQSALEQSMAVARTTTQSLERGSSPEDLLSDDVVAISAADGGACVGRFCGGLGDLSDDSLIERGGEWFGVMREADFQIVIAVPGLEARQRQARGILWPFFFIEALFVLALAYGFFTYVVMRPLRAIGVAAVRASEGDFASPINLIPRNEFGEVGRSFNQMLRRIDEGRDALEAKIDEVQRANARIASAQASLVRSEKLASVGHLAAGVAHEVGNPLAAVSGYVELLEQGDLDDAERADVLARTTRQLERIRTIIRNLLDYSRTEGQVARMATPLRSVAVDAVALVEAIPRARGRSFDIVGDATAHTFPGHIVQVLVNLLVNAIDAYGDSKGGVVLRLVEEGGRAKMVVEDEGPGIAVDDQSRIFEPFFTTKDPGEGTGLGLSICQRLIEDLDGTLEVESEEGKWTRFTIELPGETVG